jgi:hypothetical protein
VASLLAMLFLVLFSILAVGFAEATMLNAQISRNERFFQNARSSAESGIGFVRYQLGAMTLPAGTTSANLLANVAARLGSALNGTPNMGGSTVAVTGGAIYLPSQTGWVTVDKGSMSRFRATITQSGNNLVVTSRGSCADGSVVRGVQLQFAPASKPYALIGLSSLTLNNGAFSDSYDATKGAYTAATARSIGSVASNGNVAINNTSKVNGDVRYGMASTLSVANSAIITGVAAPLSRTMSYASVTLPPAGSYTDLGDMSMSSGTMNVPGGTYVLNSLTLSGTARVNWTGPVKLYIKSSYSVTGGVVITTYNNLPINRQLFFLPTCATATWNGTNVSMGELYAPDTTFTIAGSVEMMGRVTAKSITNSSSGGMHYDESLPAPNGQASYMPLMSTYLEVN